MQFIENSKIWKKTDASLKGSFKFSNFIEAFSFLTKVAILAEKHNHHPKIENAYNKVVLTLTTHDANNTVTEKDYNLAQAIEEMGRVD